MLYDEVRETEMRPQKSKGDDIENIEYKVSIYTGGRTSDLVECLNSLPHFVLGLKPAGPSKKHREVNRLIGHVWVVYNAGETQATPQRRLTGNKALTPHTQLCDEPNTEDHLQG